MEILALAVVITVLGLIKLDQDKRNWAAVKENWDRNHDFHEELSNLRELKKENIEWETRLYKWSDELAARDNALLKNEKATTSKIVLENKATVKKAAKKKPMSMKPVSKKKLPKTPSVLQ